MARTTVVLPEELRLRARERARREGISFAEFVRQAVETRLGSASPEAEEDPLFGDVPVYDGVVPANLSEDHDAYLYREAS